MAFAKEIIPDISDKVKGINSQLTGLVGAEIEISIIPNYLSFTRVLRLLKVHKGFFKDFKKVEKYSFVYIYDISIDKSKTRRHIKEISSDKYEIKEVKYRLQSIQNMKISTEKQIEEIKNARVTTLRAKNMVSFIKKFNEGLIIRIDFNEVKGNKEEPLKITDFKKVFDDIDGGIRYQIEIDWSYTREKDYSEDNMKIFLNTYNEFIKIYFDTQYIIDRVEYAKVSGVIRHLSRKHTNISFKHLMVKPVDLGFHDIRSLGLFGESQGMAVTAKADGLREIVYFSRDGIYLINTRLRVSKIYNGHPGIIGTILDCELLLDDTSKEVYETDISAMTFLVFDCLAYNNESLINENLIRRKTAGNQAVSNITTNIKFQSKNYYTFDNRNEMYIKINLVLDANWGYKTDGLIFVPVYEPYYPKDRKRSPVKKWKPPELLTIDLKVKKINGNFFTVYASDNRKEVLFKGSTLYPYSNQINGEPRELLDEHNNKIIEFKIIILQKLPSYFQFLRVRNDRPTPNTTKTAISVWNIAHTPIKEETIRGKDLVLMRKYHNREKNLIYRNYLGENTKRLLDIGSGRGGDIKKWKDIDIPFVTAIEPYDINYNEMLERIERLKATDIVTIIKKDIISAIPDIDKVSNGIVYDAVTMFDSITFFYENENKVNQLLRTVDRYLKKDGYFIVKAMDGNRVIKAMDRKNHQWGTNFEFKLSDEPKFKITGSEEQSRQISIWIKDSILSPEDDAQIEFLVDFDDLIMRMEVLGYTLEEDFHLDNEKYMSWEEEFLSVMNRMIVFKKSGFPYENSTANELLDYIKEVAMTSEEGLKMLSVGVSEVLKSINIDSAQNFELIRVGTIPDGNCLLHAILTIISRKYKEYANGEPKSIEDMKSYASGLRSDLNIALTRNKYSKLGKGETEKVYSYETAKNIVKEKNHKLGIENVLQEYITNEIGVNIIVLWHKTLENLEKGPIPYLTSAGELVYSKDRPTILLFWQQKVHFEPIFLREGDKYIGLFKHNHSLVQSVLSFFEE